MDTKTPAEKHDYHKGDHFKVVKKTEHFEKGNVVQLSDDDGSTAPEFTNVSGTCSNPEGKDYVSLDCVKKVPPEDVPKALKKGFDWKGLIILLLVAGAVVYKNFS